jgi:hypothetical protein
MSTRSLKDYCHIPESYTVFEAGTCPYCGNDERFTVDVFGTALIRDGAVDGYEGIEWEDGSNISCDADGCEWQGQVADLDHVAIPESGEVSLLTVKAMLEFLGYEVKLEHNNGFATLVIATVYGAVWVEAEDGERPGKAWVVSILDLDLRTQEGQNTPVAAMGPETHRQVAGLMALAAEDKWYSEEIDALGMAGMGESQRWPRLEYVKITVGFEPDKVSADDIQSQMGQRIEGVRSVTVNG